MAEVSEDGIEIRAVTPEHADSIREAMYSMTSKETLSRALNLRIPEDTDQDLATFIPLWLNSGLSLVAVDKRTQEVVGVRMTILETRQSMEEKKGKFRHDAVKFPKLHTLERMFRVLVKDSLTYVFDYFKTDELVHLLGLHVKPSYCRRGIASRLVAEAIKQAKEKEYKYIRSDSSSNYSRKIFENAGFETLNEITFDEFRRMGFELADTGEHQKLSLIGLKLVED